MQTIKNYKYSIIISAIICFLSLKNSNSFDNLNIFYFPHMDKIVHLCMYFGFMSVLIFETFIIAKKRYSLLVLALIPFFCGIIIEVLQGLLTTTRSASVADAIFNTLGILISVYLWLIIRLIYYEKFE